MTEQHKSFYEQIAKAQSEVFVQMKGVLDVPSDTQDLAWLGQGDLAEALSSEQFSLLQECLQSNKENITEFTNHNKKKRQVLSQITQAVEGDMLKMQKELEAIEQEKLKYNV